MLGMTFALGYSGFPLGTRFPSVKDLNQLRSKFRRANRPLPNVILPDDTLTESIRLRKFRLSAYIRAGCQRKELDLRVCPINPRKEKLRLGARVRFRANHPIKLAPFGPANYGQARRKGERAGSKGHSMNEHFFERCFKVDVTTSAAIKRKLGKSGARKV